MSRGATFGESDVTRALRAARAAGLEGRAMKSTPVTGKIVITTRTSGDNRKTPQTDLDK
jgi:hypothetical protein